MNTPYEDLEAIVDHLPDEGEAVVILRRGGSLHCEPFRPQERQPMLDPELYGRLVQAATRLDQLGERVVWLFVMAAFWVAVAYHHVSGTGLAGWYVDVGILLVAIGAYTLLLELRESHLFRTEIRPMLELQLRKRDLSRFVFIGAVHEHPELKPLFGHLARWVD